MKHLAKLLACGSILAAVAAPVITQAHEVAPGYDSQGGYTLGGDWNNGGASYDQFTQEYDHIAQMIRHSASDGTLNQRQIAGSWNELRYIRRLAYSEQQQGYYNPQIIQARLTRLHDGLHQRHDAGHRAQERGYGNDRGGYGNGYGYGYSNGDHRRNDGYSNDDDDRNGGRDRNNNDYNNYNYPR
jgi:hypothetical protein